MKRASVVFHELRKSLLTSASSIRVVSGLVVVGVAALLSLMGGHTDNYLYAAAYLIMSVITGVAAWVLLSNASLRRKKVIEIDEKYWTLRQTVGVRDELLQDWYIAVAMNMSPEALDYATSVLRVRMSRLLGVEAGQENAREHRDRWTYAVFLVAITTYPSNRVTIPESLERVFTFVPDSARNWLVGHRKVGITMMDALSKRSRDNPIWNLAATTPKKAEVVSFENTNGDDSRKTPVKEESSSSTLDDKDEVKRENKAEGGLAASGLVQKDSGNGKPASKPKRRTRHNNVDKASNS